MARDNPEMPRPCVAAARRDGSGVELRVTKQRDRSHPWSQVRFESDHVADHVRALRVLDDHELLVWACFRLPLDDALSIDDPSAFGSQADGPMPAVASLRDDTCCFEDLDVLRHCLERDREQ